MVDVMNRIKQLRKEIGWNQKELAEKLNISDSTLSNWENGRFEPGQKNLFALAEAFGVPIDYLLGRGEIDETGYVWDDSETMDAVCDSLGILSEKLAESIRQLDNNPQKMAFDILVELRHIVSMKGHSTTAALSLLQQTFSAVTRFIDVCERSRDDELNTIRIEKVREACLSDMADALDAYVKGDTFC